VLFFRLACYHGVLPAFKGTTRITVHAGTRPCHAGVLYGLYSGVWCMLQGSHHIFKRSDIGKRLDIQDCNGQAKPYQVRQFLQIVEQNDLKLGDDE